MPDHTGHACCWCDAPATYLLSDITPSGRRVDPACGTHLAMFGDTYIHVARVWHIDSDDAYDERDDELVA